MRNKSYQDYLKDNPKKLKEYKKLVKLGYVKAMPDKKYKNVSHNYPTG